MKNVQKDDRDKIFYKLDGKASTRVKQTVEQLITQGSKV
jgi:hypothetical protein